jgi:hypothetical protein
MQPPSNSLSLDWSFWAVIVAAIAVILSQLPPIKMWFKKAKLDLEVYSKISITNKLGNPNLTLHLILTNIGGRKTRIKDIYVSLSRDGKELPSLPAVNFLQNQNDKNSMLFTNFSLAPHQEWAHITNFLQFFDREEEKEFQNLKKDMLTDYREQSELIKGEEKDETIIKEKTSAIEHPNELTDRALSFFDSKFIWVPGEYLMRVNVLTSDDKANISREYRFTIFESETEQQKGHTKNYKLGGDIWWDPTSVDINTILSIKEA